MNRNSIFVIGVLSFVCMTKGIAQDTLYYKNGNLAVGNIIDIDSASGKVALQQDQSTRVLLFSTLRRIGFDNQEHLNDDFFKSQEVMMVKAPKNEINTHVPFLGENKYTYNNWLVQFDLFSPWRNDPLNFPENSNIGIGVEYFFSDRLSLSVIGRFGTNVGTHSTDTINLTNNYDYPIPYFAEMDHEFELATRFYPFSQKKFAPYFSPFIGFGELIYYHRKDFNRYYEIGEDYYYSYSIMLDRRTNNYFEWGAAAGILMNLTRSINLSTQLIFVSTNTTMSSNEYYFDNTGGGYAFEGIYDSRYRTGNVRFQVYLVCRFGGQLKEP